MAEVSEEFQRLAAQFEVAELHEYAGLCFLGASKCERAIGSEKSEVHFLLKAARAYKAADVRLENLCLQSNSNEYIQGALNCYNQALGLCESDAVMKAAIIREMKKIHPNCELISNFASPAHRAFELDLDANYSIATNDFETALEKLTEIYDDVMERKKYAVYVSLLRKQEITRILLILLLDLPPARQSPSNVRLLTEFGGGGADESAPNDEQHSAEVRELFKSLINACNNRWNSAIVEKLTPLIMAIPGLTVCQQILIKKLKEKYEKRL